MTRPRRFDSRLAKATGVWCPCCTAMQCGDCSGPLYWVAVTEPDENGSDDAYGTLSCDWCGAEHYDGRISQEASARIWGTPFETRRREIYHGRRPGDPATWKAVP